MKKILTASTMVLLLDQTAKVLASRDHSMAALQTIGNDATLVGLIPARGATLLVGATVILVVLSYVGWRLVRRGRVGPIVLGLLIGGAASNLIDRISLGYVQDFIWTSRVVFNIADVAIAIGVLGFLVGIYRTAPKAAPSSPPIRH